MADNGGVDSVCFWAIIPATYDVAKVSAYSSECLLDEGPWCDRPKQMSTMSSLAPPLSQHLISKLVVNANVTIDVPPGNYREFNLNNSSRLNFSSGDYTFSQTINIKQGISVQATGNVTITVAATTDIAGSVVLGPATTSTFPNHGQRPGVSA
jgi:hypothetical protein